MDEARDLSYLIESSEYAENATFVTECYRVMLERDVEADELFRWCRQLDGLYTRKALIVALSNSAKFGNRFAIRDLDAYKKSAWLSRALQHVINKERSKRHKEDLGATGSIPLIHKSFEYLADESERLREDEYGLLNLCQIDGLRQEIGRLMKDRFGAMSSMGEYAGILVGDADADSPSGDARSVLVTDIPAVSQVLSESPARLDDELRTCQNLLFAVPVLSDRSTGVDAVFDDKWSVEYQDGKRWLVDYCAGQVLLINKAESPIAVTVDFYVTSLVRGSSVCIRQGDNTCVVRLDNKAAHIALDTFLHPGENALSIRYVGTPSGSIYEVPNLAISHLTVNGSAPSICGDMRHFGDGFYELLIPDRAVRNRLHRQGYSEVECLRFYKDGQIIRERTTRFLQGDPNSSGENFYVRKSGQRRNDAAATSVRLYIAKKVSDIDPPDEALSGEAR